MLKSILILLILIPLIPFLGLSGCAEFQKLTGSPVAQALDPMVVNIAVGAAVGTNKATAQARAQKIKDIAATLLTDATALTSLPTLEADVNAEIAKLSLPPADLILAQQLAAALELSANAYLVSTGKQAAVVTASVAISAVLNQVIAEAKAFGAV